MPPVPSVILIVEDDLALREMLETLLEAEGYTVESAADGATALQRIRRDGIDLILLDLMLPEIDGFTLCQQVRRATDPGAPHLPIVMVTAQAQLSQQEAGFAVGADDYITKPFDQTTFLARVEVWLNVRERAKEAHAALAAEERAREEAERRLLQAQVDALHMAARELAHRCNNHMTLGVGVLELLREHPGTPAAIERLVPDALAGMGQVSKTIAQLYQVARVEARDTPFGPALDLDQSVVPASAETD